MPNEQGNMEPVGKWVVVCCWTNGSKRVEDYTVGTYAEALSLVDELAQFQFETTVYTSAEFDG